MHILNFGSLNIDYVYGWIICGQRPDHHLACARRVPGGKGLNQSIALARAGADVHHAGR